jgi:methionyl-tRNA formyltransferase
MNLVFFGSPPSAVYSLQKILEEGHNIKLIITQPDKPAGRGKKLAPSPVKKFAVERNIPVYQPARIRKDPQAQTKIEEANPELNVVVAYGQIIPAAIIYSPPLNSINLHFSLLPKYRGASPVQWAILNGEKKTGVTVFELNERMDEGDILAKKKVEILPGEYAADLEDRLSRIGAELLCETISRIHFIEPEQQAHSRASYAPRITKKDGHIDWKERSTSVDRKVRACTPWPSAYTFFAKKRFKIMNGCACSGESPPAAPGEIVAINKEGITVACGEGSLYLITELQPEGKKAMNAYAFSLGSNISQSDRFT